MRVAPRVRFELEHLVRRVYVLLAQQQQLAAHVVELRVRALVRLVHLDLALHLPGAQELMLLAISAASISNSRTCTVMSCASEWQ